MTNSGLKKNLLFRKNKIIQINKKSVVDVFELLLINKNKYLIQTTQQYFNQNGGLILDSLNIASMRRAYILEHLTIPALVITVDCVLQLARECNNQKMVIETTEVLKIVEGEQTKSKNSKSYNAQKEKSKEISNCKPTNNILPKIDPCIIVGALLEEAQENPSFFKRIKDFIKENYEILFAAASLISMSLISSYYLVRLRGLKKELSNLGYDNTYLKTQFFNLQVMSRELLKRIDKLQKAAENAEECKTQLEDLQNLFSETKKVGKASSKIIQLIGQKIRAISLRTNKNESLSDEDLINLSKLSKELLKQVNELTSFWRRMK